MFALASTSQFFFCSSNIYFAHRRAHTVNTYGDMGKSIEFKWDTKYVCLIAVVYAIIAIGRVDSVPERGKWDFVMNKDIKAVTVPKSVFAGTQIFVQITCDSLTPADAYVNITWGLTQEPCWEDFPEHYINAMPNYTGSHQVRSKVYMEKCSSGGHIMLPELISTQAKAAADSNDKSLKQKRSDALEANENEPRINRRSNGPGSGLPTDNLVYTIPKDGVYMFALEIEPVNDSKFNASVHIEIRASYGFLSAVTWPLLSFYGAMCVVYVVFGIIWLLVSFMQWRDLLRIQFWIGGVILLGMLEKAMFYAEYQSINTTGVPVKTAIHVAEWVSCAKRTLARMLVVIVSLGFGIVKPRLGPMLHRVVGTGALYFVLACVEQHLRVNHSQNDPNNQILVASIPLAVLDSAICWWIFTSLVQTTRTLRLRRNMVKLTLYRHFTNTLIFAVIASIIFMLFSIKVHRMTMCLTEWKDLWQDEAFWHVLFSSLLLVIMILWRPTNNNQRYAFTPLLDNPEDEDDDDEEDQFVADVYGVKMRGNRSSSPKPNHKATTTTEEDDLRWVEENIPSAIADAALPVLDSDEEIISTRFEVSKMQ